MMWLKKLSNLVSDWSIKLILGLIVLAASWSLFTPKFFRVHDFTHAARISELSRALADGHFPVRWSSNFGYGQGMPLYNFYAPLPYYVGAIFYSLGLNIILVIKLLFLISTVLTAWGGYQLGKDWFGRWGGILAAAALTLAPYRALSLFIRGALSEAWAIAFIPIVIWSMGSVIKQKKFGWNWLVFGLVGLFLSHNITTMLFFPIAVLLAIALLVIKFFAPFKKIDWRNLIAILMSLASAGLISLGLSAFYLIPAFLEKDFTKFQATIMTGYFDYKLHFLYIRQFFNPVWMYGGSGWGPNDDISFFLGFGQLLAAGLVILLILIGLVKFFSKKIKTLPNQLALVAVIGLITFISLYMSLQRSSIIWQAIEVLAFAQFPWRWLSIGISGLALLAAALPALLPKSWWRGSLLALVLGLILFGNFSNFRPEEFLDDATGYYYTDPKKIQVAMSDILPDYIPIQMPNKITMTENIWLNPEFSPKEVEVLVNKTHDKLVRIKPDREINFAFATADFPSWQVEVDGQKVDKHQSISGTVQAVVPEGSHLVRVYWAGTFVQNLSNFISLGAFIILIGSLVFKFQASKLAELKR